MELFQLDGVYTEGGGLEEVRTRVEEESAEAERDEEDFNVQEPAELCKKKNFFFILCCFRLFMMYLRERCQTQT